MELNTVIKTLQVRLQQPLPGQLAHKLMAPLNRSLEKPPNMVLTESAVLLLLYSKRDTVYIALMKRPKYNGVHSGQISFPGGRYEIFDKDLAATALRETKEELGIPEEDVHLIGKLSTLIIPHSKFRVHPYLGYLKKMPIFKPDMVEVEYVIEMPVSHFFDNKIKGEYNFANKTGSVLAPFFDVGGDRLWGATSMILNELLLLLGKEESHF